MKTELTNMKITHVSYVKKGANKKQFFLMKSEDKEPEFEKQVNIFFNKSDDKKLVYGVVYEPDMLDTDNEFANEIEIEKASHEFLADSRNIDLQHNFQKDYGTVVESYIAPVNFKIDKSEIKKGSWVLVTKATDEVWEQVKKGEITGYSMAGNATKVPVEDNVKKTSDDEYRGFFNFVKSFFDKDKNVEKAKDDISTVKTFQQRITAADVMDNMWRISDTLSSTIRDIIVDKNITNKQDEMNKAIDEFSAYMKKKISGIDDVKKSMSDFFIEKAGKTISTANMEQIKIAHEALGNLINITQNNDNEGEEDMKKEEFEKALKEALEPINQRIEKLEKEQKEATDTSKEVQKEDIINIIKEQFEAMDKRLVTIENGRGISKQLNTEEPTETQIKKQNVFSGLQF